MTDEKKDLTRKILQTVNAMLIEGKAPYLFKLQDMPTGAQKVVLFKVIEEKEVNGTSICNTSNAT